jgi:hypothetical protein
VWAKELRELLSATVNLLHIAHEFIPTIHAFHLMEDEDSSGTPGRPLCLSPLSLSPPPPVGRWCLTHLLLTRN